MLKTTIVLKNGATVQVECDSTSELVDILSSYESTSGVVKSESAVVNDMRSMSDTSSPINQLNEQEILMIVSKLVETNGDLKNTVDYVFDNTKSGKSRHAVHAIVSRIKMYMFEGKKSGTGISKYVKGVLKGNGIKAGSYATPTTRARSVRTPVQPWSEHDIANIGGIVKENLDKNFGLSKLVRDYVTRFGDIKNRTDLTIYAITSEIKRYLKSGKTGNMSKNVKEGLDKAGIYPASQSNFLGDINKINAVEEA